MTQERNIDSYTAAYMEGGFETYQVRFRRKKVLEILDAYKPVHILEVGCGAEPIACYYSQFSTCTIVEPSKEFCAIAQQNFAADSRVQIIHGFLEDVADALSKNFFDAVIVSGLLHEVAQPEKLLQCVKTVAGHSKLVHVNVPNANSLHIAWGEAAGIVKDKLALSQKAIDLQQHTRFTPEILSAMLAANGFTITEQGDYFVKPFNHSKMELCLQHGILDETLLEGLYSLVRLVPGLGSEIYANCVVTHDAHSSVHP